MRSVRVEMGTVRRTLVDPISAASSAIGLTTIHTSSDAGNAARRPGCAQYDVIHSVAAQQKRATAPGTTSRPDHACPPVPGHP